MRGEFIGVWQETWAEIWQPLVEREGVPADIFCELYREIAPVLKAQPTLGELADIIDNTIQSQAAFQRLIAKDLVGERALVVFLENAHDIFFDLGGDPLANEYFNLLSSFIEKFSLRYDLRCPCLLCPTLSGVFTSLVRDLKVATSQDVSLNGLMKDYEDAIRDLRTGCSESRIKTCMVKQVNLLEAMGSRFPGVTTNTVSQICEQVLTWPHDSVKDAMKNIYKFTCDYPGIRHAGTPSTARRNIEMRDMVAMSVLLTGFMPYLSNQLNAEMIYRGS